MTQQIKAPADVEKAPSTAQKTESGIAYLILKSNPDGKVITAKDWVKLHYTGWTTDGKMFDSSIPTGEPATFPIDVIISNQSDTEFDSILSTGVRVSYKNIYTTLLIGTNYSASAARPLSLGLSVGGLYRIHDFALKAGFGYRKIWDFGHSDVDDSSLGLEASVSYNIFDWFAISAGTGFNYSILKDSSFSDGIFVPTFFTALEFNLIK